jgi:hypothetical protein
LDSKLKCAKQQDSATLLSLAIQLLVPVFTPFSFPFSQNTTMKVTPKTKFKIKVKWILRRVLSLAAEAASQSLTPTEPGIHGYFKTLFQRQWQFMYSSSMSGWVRAISTLYTLGCA